MHLKFSLFSRLTLHSDLYMEYYYTNTENINIEKGELIIDGFEYRHLVRVLRKKTGDDIVITDGKRNIFKCIIVKINKASIICAINEVLYNLYEPELKIRLCVPLLRNSDRFEFLIEKAVELGVYEIQPVISGYTVPKEGLTSSKSERLRKIMIAAMGQAQRCYLPQLKDEITLTELISLTKNDINKIVMYEFAGKTSEKDALNYSDKLTILVGPEGGFSSEEIASLKENRWQILSLGERKIRSETAGIISVFYFLNQINKG